MNKILVIAKREYAAAVRTKGFIITLVLMPVLMAGSAGVQYLFKKLEDTREKRYAVIDRTPDQAVAPHLQKLLERHNSRYAFNSKTGEQIAPTFALELVPPSVSDPKAIKQQRYEVSQRIEKGEIEGLLEIGPDVIEVPPPPGGAKAESKGDDDRAKIRFQAKSATQAGFYRWAEGAVNEAVRLMRFQAAGLDPKEIDRLQTPVPLVTKALTIKDPVHNNELKDADRDQQYVNMFLPAVLIGLMFMVIMIGATPAMQGIVEEKGQRIAEVLLGSVTPFQLMAGKLLGVIGVSLTMAAVYLAGGYALMANSGMGGVLSPGLIAWFLVFLVLALLMFGSLFIAVGAAAADVKDTQTLLMPIMLIACLPFFALGPIMEEPNGTIARICSFFPFSTPMLLVARQSVPPGVPAWEMAAGIAIVLSTTLVCLWAAGRIFRVGILMTGKGATFTEMVRWVFRG